jgi:hypothetical protein
MIKSDKYDRRLKILTPSEKYCIYEKPQFTLGERRTHFRLSRYENDIIFKKLKSNNSRLYFILQLEPIRKACKCNIQEFSTTKTSHFLVFWGFQN